MNSFKYTLAFAAAFGALTLAASGAMAEDAHVKTTTTKTTVGVDADVKTGEVLNSAPGDVKTSNDDSGMNHDDAAHDKVGTVEGEATPGDVKTSNDDSGMVHDEAPHDKAVVNGEVVK